MKLIMENWKRYIEENVVTPEVENIVATIKNSGLELDIVPPGVDGVNNHMDNILALFPDGEMVGAGPTSIIYVGNYEIRPKYRSGTGAAAVFGKFSIKRR